MNPSAESTAHCLAWSLTCGAGHTAHRTLRVPVSVGQLTVRVYTILFSSASAKVAPNRVNLALILSFDVLDSLHVFYDIQWCCLVFLEVLNT